MKKTVVAVAFVLVLALAAVLNFVVFPYVLRSVPESDEVKSVLNDSVNLEQTNKILNNVIPEKKAIQIALDKAHDLPGVSEDFDFESASVHAEYVNGEAPTDTPKWYVIFLIRQEDYIEQMPDEITPDMIDELAWEKGLVWMEDGKIFAHYDFKDDFVIVGINAISGEIIYNKYLFAYDEHDEMDIFEKWKEVYGVDIQLSDFENAENTSE
ncbi:MAG: hypothetical protein ACI4F6_00700 [Acutalibacteraceae bacterium]